MAMANSELNSVAAAASLQLARATILHPCQQCSQLYGCLRAHIRGVLLPSLATTDDMYMPCSRNHCGKPLCGTLLTTQQTSRWFQLPLTGSATWCGAAAAPAMASAGFPDAIIPTPGRHLLAAQATTQGRRTAFKESVNAQSCAQECNNTGCSMLCGVDDWGVLLQGLDGLLCGQHLVLN
jgi:hypothetical protein